MNRSVPESDWTLFRELRATALDRFCEGVLDEVRRVLLDASQSNHERYVVVHRLLKDRDGTLARTFNDPRRSTMIEQLGAIQALGLLKAEELLGFTPETRGIIEFLGRGGHR